MTFAFCLNENEILLQAVFGLLLESVELGNGSAVHKESVKLALTVVKRFDDQESLGHEELSKVLAVWSITDSPRSRQSSTKSSVSQTSHPEGKESLHRRGLKALASRLSRIQEKSTSRSDPKSRQSTYPYNMSPPNTAIYSNPSRNSHTPMFARSESSLSPQHTYATPALNRSQRRNLQSYDLPSTYESTSNPTRYSNEESSPHEWAKVLSNLDSGQNNIYDVIYGGPGASSASLVDYASITSSSPDQSHIANFAKSPLSAEGTQSQSLYSSDHSWNLTSSFANPSVNIPTSVLSFSSDETPSLDDFCDLGFPSHMGVGEYGKSIVIPGDGTPPLMGSTTDAGWIAGLDPLFSV
jgi:hypothetical protein